jgi:hypothetical protein
MIDVRDESSQATLDPGLKEVVEDDAETKKGFVYCALCSHVVSHIDQRTEVNGSHDHYFVNPHGLEFHVGCYEEALGCAISGQPTAADTWFPGFHWHIATCEECNIHLGWLFANAEASSFYGLILDRIQTD